jgi:hypothetical protein
MKRRLPSFFAVASALAAALAGAAHAQAWNAPGDWFRLERTQVFPGSQWQPGDGRDEPRSVPFSQIERQLKSRFGGELLDASMQGSVYVVSWLDGEGRRLVIEVDAATGRVLSVRG